MKHDGEHWRHNAVTCRACGYRITGATSITDDDGDGPESGAFSVCLRCGEVAVYEISVFGVSLREATMDELAEFGRCHGDKLQRLHLFRAVFPLDSQDSGGLDL